MPAFARYIGIDYSGAETPTASLKGLRVYRSDDNASPVEVPPPSSPRKYWTRRGVAEWLVALLAEDRATLVGIDHGFSFPQRGCDDQMADGASGAWSADIRELVRTAIDRIVIRHDGIEIALKSNAIDHAGRFVDGDTQHESPTTGRLALPPARPRARKQIIVPGNSGTRPRRIDHELIRALARARSWMGMLQRGEFADTAEIAEGHGLSEPHVRRLLRFAYLAPDIVEAIAEGRQPRMLTVKLLLKGIPLDWSDQCAAFDLR